MALCTGLGSGGFTLTAAAEEAQPEASVLVFSKTAGFRHDSIPAGIAAIQQLGAEHNFAVDATEDAEAFTDDNLANYDAVVFLSTTGDVLNDEQQAAFERYISEGGGYVGVHAASDTEYDWPWYGHLVGAYFATTRTSRQRRSTSRTRGIRPQRTSRTAGYAPTSGTTTGRTRGQERPCAGHSRRGQLRSRLRGAWATITRSPGVMRTSGGRAWYTGAWHTVESFCEPEFARAPRRWDPKYAAGLTDADCSTTDEPEPEAPVDSDFDQITLARGADVTGEPMALSVLPDGRVLHTSRDGRVFLTTPEGNTSVAATLDVYNHDEDGLQGIAVDPNFEENHWVYLYYAPRWTHRPVTRRRTAARSDFEPFKGYNQLSRFKLTDEGTFDLSSEQQILQVPADRGICCHAGGEIDFDADGNLLLSTGDDTNPFASDGYTPIDERANRNPAFDAQRSSGNTNDLRGKILRITVQEDGSYTIPRATCSNRVPRRPGPRSTRWASATRSGSRWTRRPAGSTSATTAPTPVRPTRPRPGGHRRVQPREGPGNYGWPYCVGDNEPFIDYDFDSGTPGEKFDCSAPVNDCPNNTGLTELPPASPRGSPTTAARCPSSAPAGVADGRSRLPLRRRN